MTELLIFYTFSFLLSKQACSHAIFLSEHRDSFQPSIVLTVDDYLKWYLITNSKCTPFSSLFYFYFLLQTHWLKTDFQKWRDEDDSDQEQGEEKDQQFEQVNEKDKSYYCQVYILYYPFIYFTDLNYFNVHFNICLWR